MLKKVACLSIVRHVGQEIKIEMILIIKIVVAWSNIVILVIESEMKEFRSFDSNQIEKLFLPNAISTKQK